MQNRPYTGRIEKKGPMFIRFLFSILYYYYYYYFNTYTYIYIGVQHIAHRGEIWEK